MTSHVPTRLAAYPLTDQYGRPLRSLRISVTDRCNMRCRYCMPEEDYLWLPRGSILSFEEIDRLVGIFAGLGVHKVRLTGGEPLFRSPAAFSSSQLRIRSLRFAGRRG